MIENMLRTSQERVRLLRNGMESKKIEELYIQYNNLKIIHSPILFELSLHLKGIAEAIQKDEHSPDAPEQK